MSASFACESPDDCLDGAIEGVCEADGYCSFVDEDCGSGRRYGAHSPAGIANDCTPGEAGSSSTDAPQPVSETTPVSGGDEDTGNADGGDADAGDTTSDSDPDRLQMSHGGESSSGDESSGSAESSDGDGGETSAGSDGVEPQDCNVLDCDECLDCAAAPDGPCDDEVAACEAVNGCTSGVACWDDCLLTGACFDPCCEGDGDAQIDQLVLCRADHCIDACSRYEFLTCG